MNKNTRKLEKILIILFLIIISAIYSYYNLDEKDQVENILNNVETSYEISNIPEYSGKIYIEINNNIPVFTEKDMNLEGDYYSSLKSGKVRNGNDKN